MKRLLVFLAAWWWACSWSAVQPETPPSVDFQAVPVSQLVQLYYREVLKGPYVICADVLADQRPVSIRAEGKQLDAAVLSSVLDVYGFEARREASGVTYVCKRSEKGADSLPPFVYRPKYRSASYLVDVCAPLVHGTFANRRVAPIAMSVTPDKGDAPPVVSSVGSSMQPSASDELIVFSGADREVQRLKSLLEQLDTRQGEVVVRAYLYEVGKGSDEGSAVAMMLDLLKSRIQLQVTSTQQANSLTINAGGLDLVASILNQDNRFKVMTSPWTRVRSGSSGRFQVGQDVPVLGAIVANGNGQTSQSVNYASSGTIIEVTPQVHGDLIDLDLDQTVSDFVQTGTGLAASPTLNKRELRTSLSVKDGELVVMGGLNQSNDSTARSRLPWLPWDVSRTGSSRSSELVLVLEVKRI